MPSLHVVAWVAVIVTAGVLAAFVAVEGCRYLLRGRNLARLAREFRSPAVPPPGAALVDGPK